MAWRAPRYGILHAARLSGLASITGLNAWSATEPKDHLIDDRAGSLARFAASDNDHYIQIDRGAGTLEGITRLWIPAGHNWAGADYRLRAATDSGITTSVDTLVATVASPSDGSAIDQSFASNTKRYIRLDWPAETGQWALGELVLTNTRTTTRGPEQGWEDSVAHNVLVQALESGAEAALVLGADRRRFDFRYRDVKDSADLTLFADLIEDCGLSHPFLLDPPFDTEAVVWARLQRDVENIQDPRLPAATGSPQRQLRLSILEHVA